MQVATEAEESMERMCAELRAEMAVLQANQDEQAKSTSCAHLSTSPTLNHDRRVMPCSYYSCPRSLCRRLSHEAGGRACAVCLAA